MDTPKDIVRYYHCEFDSLESNAIFFFMATHQEKKKDMDNYALVERRRTMKELYMSHVRPNTIMSSGKTAAHVAFDIVCERIHRRNQQKKITREGGGVEKL